MNGFFDFRPLLAATAMLLLLAGAYEVAPRGPLALPELETARLENSSAPANDIVTDSVVQEAAPLLAPASPTSSATADNLAKAKEAADTRQTNDSLAREYHARLRQCPPEPLRYRETPRAGPPPPRRYVGTVGGERITAELSWTRPDSVVGRFYFWRSGAEYSLASYHSTRVLALWPELRWSSRNGQCEVLPSAAHDCQKTS